MNRKFAVSAHRFFGRQQDSFHTTGNYLTIERTKMPITYKMLADTVPAGVTLDIVRGTDIMFTDGEASGAVAKLIHGDSVLYVWPNGRIWARSGGVAVAVATWIATLQKPRHVPDTNSSVASTIPVV